MQRWPGKTSLFCGSGNKVGLLPGSIQRAIPAATGTMACFVAGLLPLSAKFAELMYGHPPTEKANQDCRSEFQHEFVELLEEVRVGVV
jgi:hypothetical protein